MHGMTLEGATAYLATFARGPIEGLPLLQPGHAEERCRDQELEYLRCLTCPAIESDRLRTKRSQSPHETLRIPLRPLSREPKKVPEGALFLWSE